MAGRGVVVAMALQHGAPHDLLNLEIILSERQMTGVLLGRSNRNHCDISPAGLVREFVRRHRRP
jgi:hypothetical protein